MKGILIYDSISGSTKKVAQAIHAGMRQTGETCDIARLREVTADDLAGYDLIGGKIWKAGANRGHRMGYPLLDIQEASL